MTDNPTPPDRLLWPDEVCERIGVVNTTLQDWRLTWKEGGARKGPAFVRLGHRTVRYRESAVAAYLAGLGAGQDG